MGRISDSPGSGAHRRDSRCWKAGGVLRVHLWDSPPNLLSLEGANPLALRALMPVFNNLVTLDQHASAVSARKIRSVERETRWR